MSWSSRLCVGKTAWWTITMKKMIEQWTIEVDGHHGHEQHFEEAGFRLTQESVWRHVMARQPNRYSYVTDRELRQQSEPNAIEKCLQIDHRYRPWYCIKKISSHPVPHWNSSKKQSRKNRAHQDDTSNGSETRQHSRGDRRKSGVVVAEAEQLPSSRLSSENELMNTTYFHERANKEQRWIESSDGCRDLLKQQHERDQHQNTRDMRRDETGACRSSIGWDVWSATCFLLVQRSETEKLWDYFV
jgi:hypothetical protein